MSSHDWKALFCLVVVSAIPIDARSQTYDELSAMVSGPWHHVPNAVGTLQFNRDNARCAVVSAQTPINSTTPSVVERVRWTVQINCLKASGYEPGAKVTSVARQSIPAKTNLSDLQAAGGGVGISICSEFTRVREKPEFEALFLTWTQGFITGWNMGVPDDSGFAVEMSGLSRDEQKRFMRDYCEANPTKRYLEGVTALMSRLSAAKSN